MNVSMACSTQNSKPSSKDVKKSSVIRAETHKYYEECDWSKKWAEGLQKVLTGKVFHQLDINDYLFTFVYLV